MTTLVIQHVKASELPAQWARQLNTLPDQTVTIRIETEVTSTNEAATSFVTNDPALWHLAGCNDIRRRCRLCTQSASFALQPRRLTERGVSMLVDTDVMIWHLRGYPAAAQRLDQLEQLDDAHVAATALEHKLTVLTGNVKHFKAIGDLVVERFEPG